MKHEHLYTPPTTTLATGEVASLVLHAYRTRKTKVSIAVLLGISFFCWSAVHAFFPPPTEDTIHFLDVGQGDAALITLTKHGEDPVRILVDGGRDGSVLSALADLQHDTPFQYIDLVILSHQDSDHYAGLIPVLETYAVGAFISNGNNGDEGFETLLAQIQKKNVPHYILTEHDRIQYASNTLDILLPTKELLATGNTNEASLVFLLSHAYATGTTTALFTGDIGTTAEEVLLAQDIPLSADILKIGHHGSKYSSSPAFIHAVAPLISVISVGKNTYGHPAPETIDTLTRAGSLIYTTQNDGTVRVPLNPETKPETEQAPRGFLASVLLGSRTSDFSTIASLAEAEKQHGDMHLTPVTTCTYDAPAGTVSKPVHIHEVAWMGATTGTTHEWVELTYTGNDVLDISGWQLINANGRVHATFPQDSTARDPFILIARSAANDALSLNAHLLFTGALRNSNEGLRLFDNECNLVDEVPLSSSWPAGNTKTKQTMARQPDGTWSESSMPDGTPGEQNAMSSSNTDQLVPEETPKESIRLSFIEESDGTFTVGMTATLPSHTYDIKAGLYQENSEITETFYEKENRWRASLYYLPEVFTGEQFDGTMSLRRKKTFATAAGPAVLVVRIREHGTSTFTEATTTVTLQTPDTPTPKQKTKTSTPKEPSAPSYTLTAEYPDTIFVAEPFDVHLHATGLTEAPYDLKVSVESGGVLSKTQRDGVWSSSVFYVPLAFTGPSVENVLVSLLVPTSTTPLPSSAELIVRIRTGDASGFVAFRGPIALTPHEETHTTPTTTETTSSEEEPDTEENSGPVACININTADSEALDQITQIGPALAARIIAERELSAFLSLDDLLRVSGIGTTTLDKIKVENLACI